MVGPLIRRTVIESDQNKLDPTENPIDFQKLLENQQSGINWVKRFEGGLRFFLPNCFKREKTGEIVCISEILPPFEESHLANKLVDKNVKRTAVKTLELYKSVLNQPLQLKHPDIHSHHFFKQNIDSLESLLPIIPYLETNSYDLNSLSGKQWKALDVVHFELTQNKLLLAAQLLNSTSVNEVRELLAKHFNVDFSKALVSEILAKNLAYTLDQGGKILSIPIKQQNGFYLMIEYTVREFTVGDNLPVYILEADQKEVVAPPFMVIRGTETTFNRKGSIESLQMDLLDAEGIAVEPLYKSLALDKNEKSIHYFFDKWEKEGKKPIITGHSLGGFLSLWIGVHFLSKIDGVFTFNSPGVSNSLVQIYREQCKKSDTPNPQDKIVNFVREGDPVSGLESHFIGQSIETWPSNSTNDKGIQEIHSEYILLGAFNAQKIDCEKEQENTHRRRLNMVRQLASYCLKNSDIFKTTPDWWTQKSEYLVKYQTALREHLGFN
ncbi:MAG: hypothetical protein Tsb0021_15170 [Chlamydiales bacterium]